MQLDVNQTEKRKVEHIEICINKPVQYKKSNGFDHVELIYDALPDVDLADVNTGLKLFGKEISAPIMISGMTGGTKIAGKINKGLARAAHELNIPMGVGSQRAAVERPELAYTFQIRDVAPDILLFGNLGLAQFCKGYGSEQAKQAVEMIDADVLAIHINPAHESAQPEGDTDFSCAFESLKQLKKNVDFPIMAKEVGNGISKRTAIKLAKTGVDMIDVGGAGGTSWIKVEYYRTHNKGRERVIKPFLEWGIPTAQSLWNVSQVFEGPIVATGGIRNGLHVAKAVAMGATLTGVAYPALKWYLDGGTEKVISELRLWIDQLKRAMMLVGAKNLSELGGKFRIVKPWDVAT